MGQEESPQKDSHEKDNIDRWSFRDCGAQAGGSRFQIHSCRLIAHTPSRLDQAGKQAVEHAIAGGRGGLFLDLTADQYLKL
jgi:hypothetical protein